jgi:atypical dual specificity phosphatase
MDIWWIDKPNLLGSRNPTISDLKELRGEGFEVLVSLLNEKQQAPYYDISSATSLGYKRHNIGVSEYCPPTVKQLVQFVKLVDGLPLGTKIVVHCEGGIGRTGTFAAAYWIAKGKTVEEAIKHVRKARRYAVETPEQEAALHEFDNWISRHLRVD